MSDRRGNKVASLELCDVVVAYGSTVAVGGVSLVVEPGETLAIVGPSGSGKSTLLRAVAGLEPLVGGDILMSGRSLLDVATHERDLGLMFQDHALFTHLDVSDNVAFGLRMKGWSGQRRRSRVDELLALVGLAGFGHRAVHELSGGEAQRVALARALAPTPGLLMLDEPFGSLDRLLREELTAELRRLLAELGQTALHVTHDQVEAFALADRVAVLADGRLHQIGPPDEVWRSPSSAFVAEFVGHQTIWSVDVDSSGGVVVDGQRFAGLNDWPQGTCAVVVPLDAVRPNDHGELQVLVEESVFREGRYRVTARLGAADREGQGVTFESREALRKGAVALISVDSEALHRLAER